MGIASRAGDWTFKAFTAGLGVATIYLAATFSVNVYRGLSWHNAQSRLDFLGGLRCPFTVFFGRRLRFMGGRGED
ncbi:hypothetical protein SADUNF_Sadunf12G0056000 [Salix dunnii]|uniref:Uncharacterized protein n=1 Tax=Salix dunnii TaxID=1413687 RepID=A0A835JN81_9ROSI|nr:hypothetical protein SADUNF_Sadunf12G0056000 [Salix dunnii]